MGGSVGAPPPTTSTIIQDAASDVAGNPAVASAATSAATGTAYQQDYFEFSTAQAAADLIKLAEVLMCIVGKQILCKQLNKSLLNQID